MLRFRLIVFLLGLLTVLTIRSFIGGEALPIITPTASPGLLPGQAPTGGSGAAEDLTPAWDRSEAVELSVN